ASDSSEVVGSVTACRPDAVASALAAGVLAAAAWGRRSADDRAACLDSVAGRMERSASRLGALLVLESGATMAEAAD
ncbi:aldehyde dehydrogenase family protein, partial [Escherichia coli]|nr:aldehyde dehydrogenase family protein [Escherichia coli]